MSLEKTLGVCSGLAQAPPVMPGNTEPRVSVCEPIGAGARGGNVLKAPHGDHGPGRRARPAPAPPCRRREVWDPPFAHSGHWASMAARNGPGV